MESKILIQTQQPLQFMSTSKLFTPLLSSQFSAASSVAFKLFSASAASIITTNAPPPDLIIEQKPEPATSRNGKAAGRGSKGIMEAQLKEDWLGSLSCPFPHTEPPLSGWVIGVDPDTCGALALLKPDHSAQVFDSPHLKVLVGKGVRKRLDAKSIVQLLQSFEAPIGTTVYIEQSTPYPQDGMVEWRIWLWNVDWYLSCFGILRHSCAIKCVEE